jgi:3-hexulose-6-phosphate synthase
MKFQLALDVFETAHAISAAEELGDLFHILEIGTPLILKEGYYVIKEIRKCFPHHDILADYKMMDAGSCEAHIAFEAGASIVTVCGCANSVTIREAVEQARRDGGQVSIDMIEVKDFEKYIAVYDLLGADYIQVHVASDGRGSKSPLKELVIAKRVLKKTKCAVAGGIGEDNIAEISKNKPDLIVIGSKVMKAPDRRATMLKIIEIVKLNGGVID